MALSGRFTNLGAVLERIDLVSEEGIDAQSAALWAADVLFKMRGSIALKQVVTDGVNGPKPILIEDFRGELPCDLVEPQQFYELTTLRPLRESNSPSHAMQIGKYKPDMWVNGSVVNLVPVGGLEFNTSVPNNNTVDRTVLSQSRSSINGDFTFSLNQNYIFTGFEKGYVIAAYKAWPMDEEGNLLIPSDPPILNGIAAYLQERIDYKLWRRGMIADKVYYDSQQNRSWDVQAAINHSVMPSLSQMESISNIMTSMIQKDHYFQTHFTSLGRNENIRIH